MRKSTARAQRLPVVASIGGAAVVPVGAGEARTPHIAGPRHPSVSALLAHQATAEAVILYPTDAVQAAEWAIELRRDARYALAPVFTRSAFGEAVDALIDGVADDLHGLFERIGAVQERIELLATDALADPEQRLLAFLYTRPRLTLAPVCDWRSESVYHYPLLDAFTPPGTSANEWLPTLRRRGLIEPVTLVDRIRQCPACAAAHLSYVDVCPQCTSLDIGECMFLHCHTCGHVARQDQFLSRGALECPKCVARLRHIGVDYDRALEAYACNACNGRFTEAQVRAQCLHCRASSATEDLPERRIESFRLSDAGQLAARTGQIGELFALIDEFNCVHPAYFEQTLDFLLNLGRRHPEIECALVCMRFANVRALLAELPRVQVSQMIDGFAARLGQLVRTTDLVLRTDDEHCWLLLPQTPAAGLEVLLERIKRLPGDAQPGSTALTLTVAAGSSRMLQDRPVDAQLLMAELKAEVS